MQNLGSQALAANRILITFCFSLYKGIHGDFFVFDLVGCCRTGVPCHGNDVTTISHDVDGQKRVHDRKIADWTTSISVLNWQKKQAFKHIATSGRTPNGNIKLRHEHYTTSYYNVTLLWEAFLDSRSQRVLDIQGPAYTAIIPSLEVGDIPASGQKINLIAEKLHFGNDRAV